MKFLLTVGHGAGDPGAVANGTQEFIECTNIADELCKLMEGVIPYVRIPTMKLVDRIAFINKNHADATLLLELHMNSAGNQNASYAEMYYHADSKEMQTTASTMIADYSRLTGIHNNGAKKDTLTRHKRLGIVRDTKPKALLIELGFVSNTMDLSIVRGRGATALFTALKNHFHIMDQEILNQIVSSWAEASFVNAEKKGFTRTNPQEIIGTPRLRKILVKSGFLIADNGEQVTYEQIITAFDRDGKFN